MKKNLLRFSTLCLLAMMALVGRAESITATWDFTNKDVVAEVTALSGKSEAGTVKAVENNGILLTVEANGQSATMATVSRRVMVSFSRCP